MPNVLAESILILIDLRNQQQQPIPICSGSTNELVKFLESEKAIFPYASGGITKHFKKGGPLEWFRAPEPKIGTGIHPVAMPPSLEDFRKDGG